MNDGNPEDLMIVEATPRISGVRVGKIVGLGQDGKVVVDYAGNPFGPLPARKTASITAKLTRQAFMHGLDVLLAFEDSDPGKPVLFDLVEGKKTRRPRPAKKARAAAPSPTQPGSGTILGRLVSVHEGQVFVEYPGNSAGPLPARTTVPLRNFKDEVLLVLTEDGVFIVGQLFESVPMETPGSADAEVVLKGKRVRIEAGQDLVLVAGRSKIHLDARGTAVTTSDHIVSRARAANKVQGGSVQLN